MYLLMSVISTTIRRTIGREVRASRHHGAPLTAPESPAIHHDNIIPRRLREGLVPSSLRGGWTPVSEIPVWKRIVRGLLKRLKKIFLQRRKKILSTFEIRTQKNSYLSAFTGVKCTLRERDDNAWYRGV